MDTNELAVCEKCGNPEQDYDPFFKEYTCRKCGWIRKKAEESSLAGWHKLSLAFSLGMEAMCEKCGSLEFEYDASTKEYNCDKCGLIVTKEVNQYIKPHPHPMTDDVVVEILIENATKVSSIRIIKDLNKLSESKEVETITDKASRNFLNEQEQSVKKEIYNGDLKKNNELIKLCEKGKAKKIKKLLQSGTNPNCYDENGWTPLHWASVCGHVKVIDMLLSEGAILTAKTTSGLTALHLASWYEKESAVASLLSKGIEVDLVNPNGVTSLQLAVAGRLPHRAPESGKQLESVKLLVDAGASVSSEDLTQCTALHYAAYCTKKRSKIIKLLLESGADINARQINGQTPLHFAARSGSTDNIIQLLRSGAKVNIKNNSGYTALNVALPRPSVVSIFKKFIGEGVVHPAATVVHPATTSVSLPPITKQYLHQKFGAYSKKPTPGNGGKIFDEAVPAWNAYNYDKAFELLNKAIEAGLKGPECSTAHSILGQIYLRRGQLGQAVNEYLKCLEIPDRVTSMTWQSAMHLYYIYSELGRDSEAESVLLIAEKANQGHVWVHNAEAERETRNLARNYVRNASQ